MTEAPTAAPPLPTARECPLDPPAALLERQRSCPVGRLGFPDGAAGWLITGYDNVRAALADPRFSSRKELLRSPFSPHEPTAAEPGFFIYTDPPEHTAQRHLLTGQFTLRRMVSWTERIERIAADCLDAMEAAGPPADLVPSYAMALTSQVICELLGVPHEDRADFQRDSAVILDTGVPLEQAMAAVGSMQRYLRDLVEARRREPSDDIIGGLAGHPELTVEQVANIGFLLLSAGLDTTSNMISLGTYALLTHPEQLDALRADPALIDAAVEELTRYLTVNHYGPIRAAAEDFEFAGVGLKQGETVVLSAFAANRDPARYPEPDRLDFARGGRGHLSFGHGIHQCIGQQLARVEMRIGFSALLGRFPGLRLAVPPGQVPMRDKSLIYGVHSLPVAW